MYKQQIAPSLQSSTSKGSPRYTFIPTSIALVLLTVIFSSSLEKVLSQQTDGTTVERATGRDIVEAVIRRILRAQIFPEDYSFMLRLAYVESRFGEHSLTFRDGYFGGIWQVDEWKFEITQNSTFLSILQPLHTAIQTHFNMNWMSVKWQDLMKPLYSGLALRLFLAINTTSIDSLQIPDTINRQANFWDVYYRMGEDRQSNIFHQESVHLQEILEPCNARLDLLVAIDGSSSIGREHFQDFVRNVAFLLPYTFQQNSQTRLRIGSFIYSNKMFYLFELENELSLEKMRSLIENARFPFGDSRTDLALEYGLEIFRKASPRSPGVPQVLLFFQEGNSTFPVKNAASLVAANNITTIVVGIGNQVDDNELLEMGLGKRENVFRITGFGSMPDIFFRLSPVLCTIAQKPLTPGVVYQDTLGRRDKRYYVVEIPNENGVTVFINLQLGSPPVNGYWAYNDESPQDTVYDGLMDGVTYISAQAEWNENIDPATGLLMNDSSALIPSYPQKAYFSVEGDGENCVYEVFIKEGNWDNDFGFGGSSRAMENMVGVTYFVLSGIYFLLFKNII